MGRMGRCGQMRAGVGRCGQVCSGDVQDSELAAIHHPHYCCRGCLNGKASCIYSIVENYIKYLIIYQVRQRKERKEKVKESKADRVLDGKIR